MVIDELVVQIRATAEGVKHGVNVATTELRKLQTEKERLQESLKLKVESDELKKLYSDLERLEAKKKELERSAKFSVEAENIAELKQTLIEIDVEKTKLKQRVKMEVDTEEVDKIWNRIVELDAATKRLSRVLNLAVKIDMQETGRAKLELQSVNNEIAKINRDIAIHMETSGINQARQDIGNLNTEMAESERTAAAMEKQASKLAVTAAAAFGTVVVAAKKAVTAYSETVEIQTKLTHLMGVNQDATTKQAGEIIKLTKEYERYGVVSAIVQQAAVQELSTYMDKIENLQNLLPVINDVMAQQYGYNTSVSNGVSVATMFGKAMDGQSGALKRFGYILSEAQEKILELGTEEERVAVLTDVVANAVGGMNEALKETDSAAIASLRNEIKSAYSAFGGALTPGVVLFAKEMSKALGFIREFIEKHKGVAAGATAFAAVTLAVTAYTAATKIAIVETLALAAAKAAVDPLTVAFGLLAMAVTGVGMAVAESLKKSKEMLEAVEQYKKFVEEGIVNEDEFKRAEEISETFSNWKKEVEDLSKAFEGLNEQVEEELSPTYEGFGNAIEKQTTIYSKLKDALKHYEIELELTGDMQKDAANAVKALDARMNELNASMARFEQTAANLPENLIDIKESLLDVEALSSEYSQTLGALESAHRSLSNGQKLSFDTTLKLIEQFPEIAKLIANEGELRKEHIGIIETEAETLRTSALKEMEIQKALLEKQIEEAKRSVETEREKYRLRAEIASRFWAGSLEALKYMERVESEFFKGALEEIAAAEEALNGYNHAIAAISAVSANFGSSGGLGGGGSSTSKKVKEEIDEIEEAYKGLLKVYDTDIQLHEYTAKEKIEKLEEIKRKVEELSDTLGKPAGDITVEIDTKIRPLDLEEKNAWFSREMKSISRMFKDNAELTDYQAVINSYERLKGDLVEIYKDFPVTLQTLYEQIDEQILDTLKQRGSKLLGYAAKETDDLTEEYKRRNELLKARAGIEYTDDFGEKQTYKYTAEDEIEHTQKLISVERERIEELQSLNRELTGDEYNELKKRGKNVENHLQTIKKLEIQSIKDIQAEQRKAYEEDLKLLENELKEREDAAKKANKKLIADIKERYAEEIRLLEERSDAEIKIYSDRINEINEILKSESREESDAEFADRMRRLQEQINYEIDPGNIYEMQKEMAREQSEFDKRKRKEALEDEKSILQSQINEIKDTVRTRKDALQKIRDDEIKAAEESLELFIEELNKKREELDNYENNVTEGLKRQLEVREQDTKDYLKREFKAQEANERDKRRLAEETTVSIIDDLKSRLYEFAEAGRQAGQMWAQSYRDEVVSILSGIDYSIGVGGGGYSGGQSVNNYSFDMTQNFNTPVATPSKMAIAARDMWSDIQRYGLSI